MTSEVADSAKLHGRFFLCPSRYNPVMSDIASPKVPQYRMTLFYGPEQDESDADMVYCVFNVKKRSWKGGVQVVVEIGQAQLSNIRKLLDFDHWLHDSLRHIPEIDQEDYFDRGHDIFVQQVCQNKLQLAIAVGLRQENSRMPKDFLATELTEALRIAGSIVKDEVLQELDIELPDS